MCAFDIVFAVRQPTIAYLNIHDTVITKPGMMVDVLSMFDSRYVRCFIEDIGNRSWELAHAAQSTAAVAAAQMLAACARTAIHKPRRWSMLALQIALRSIVAAKVDQRRYSRL